METTRVWAPDALLFHRQLGKAAKLFWMIVSLDTGSDHASAGPSPRRLQARSGLSRHTVLRALAQLRADGRLPTGTSRDQGQTDQAGAWVPAALLLDTHLSVQAKLTYAILGRAAGCRSHEGQFTYTELCNLTGTGRNTLKRAIRVLQATGWLEISQRNQLSPIRFVLQDPAAARQEAALARVERRLRRASYLGEALMREYLSLLVDNDEFDDDASPGFLVNPVTGEEMEFDRYYAPSVAFEFQGPQHYGPTAQYPDEVAARQQQARDYIKMGICWARGISLAVVHPQDLSLEGMRQQVAGLLPLRNLTGEEALISYLENVSAAYRRKARLQGSARGPSQGGSAGRLGKALRAR